eukprot:657554-Pelagomonas_calceolata.AAC.1
MGCRVSAGNLQTNWLTIAFLMDSDWHLREDTGVCREGQVLDPHQVAVLRVFDIKMATFKLKLLAVWQEDKVEELAEDDEDGGAGSDEENKFDELP